jgi:hypothetical protein
MQPSYTRLQNSGTLHYIALSRTEMMSSAQVWGEALQLQYMNLEMSLYLLEVGIWASQQARFSKNEILKRFHWFG